MSSTVEQVFSQWAREGRGERMAEGHWPRTKQIIARMGIEPGMAGLDVGCGNGYAVRAMAQHTGASGSVLGVDFSADMINTALKNSENPTQVTFQQSAAEKLPLKSACIDHLLSVEMLYYASDISAVLLEWHRVLKPGGSVWVMMDFYEENPYCHTWPADLGVSTMALWGEAQYKAAFKQAGFTTVTASRIFDPRLMSDADREAFTPGWGYASPDDVVDFRTKVGSLLVHAQK